MQKQRFIAEMANLIIFMTPEDKEATLRRYAAMFDEAGPEGEELLLAELVSPTRVVVGLARAYTPGAPLEAERARPAPAAPAPAETAETAPAAAVQPPVPTEAPAETAEGEKKDEAALWQELFPQEEAPAPAEAKRPARPLGIALFALIIIIIGVPLFALAIALIPAALLPGAAAGLASGLAAVAGLWTLSSIPACVFVFGCAAAALGLTLLLLVLGVWGCVWLFRFWFRGARTLRVRLIAGRADK